MVSAKNSRKFILGTTRRAYAAISELAAEVRASANSAPFHGWPLNSCANANRPIRTAGIVGQRGNFFQGFRKIAQQHIGRSQRVLARDFMLMGNGHKARGDSAAHILAYLLVRVAVHGIETAVKSRTIMQGFSEVTKTVRAPA